MNTLWNCDAVPRVRPVGLGLSRIGLAGSVVLACAVTLSSLSCTYSGGELLYFLGVGRGAKVEARFKLTEGPLMVFIDDVHERVDWPRARAYLCDDLSQELLHNRAAKRIVPRETIDALRQSMADFETRGARELGEMVGAEQVLWVEMHDFLAEERIADPGTAAYWTVTVKVLNAREKESRTRVRLWPTSPEGHIVSASLAGADVDRLKTKDAISKELSEKLVVDIAKLFYDHRKGDFDP
jgi:hypothetical protein